MVGFVGGFKPVVARGKEEGPALFCIDVQRKEDEK